MKAIQWLLRGLEELRRVKFIKKMLVDNSFNLNYLGKVVDECIIFVIVLFAEN